MRLSERFNAIAVTGRGDLVAVPIAPGSPHRIARTPDGRPMLLFRTPRDFGRQAFPAIRLVHIHASASVNARLSTDGRTEEGCFATVELSRAEPELVPFFLDTLQPIADQFPGETEAAELLPLLNRVQELFRSLSEEPRNTALGLWGELFVLNQSVSLHKLLRAWHVDPRDPVDFISDDLWLEVKTTTRDVRRHPVTARQLRPPPGSQGFLVSLLTVPNPTGTSVRDLVARIDAGLDQSDLRQKLREVVSKQLGSELRKALDIRFDEATAANSIRTYDMWSLPRLSEPWPSEISDVQYTLDLSSLAPSDDGRSLLPRAVPS